ncbi:hypothetical protein MKEN_01252100 [Mycena kentingensis (nom. inval.)]|nr:hypothetical protein MKEN_01252100 [Mycena kentingensis (nom. inval.)]
MAAALPPEIHHLVTSFITQDLGLNEHGDPIDFGKPTTVRRVPRVSDLNALSQTCRTLYNNINWVLSRAFEDYGVLRKIALRFALENSRMELFERLVQLGAPIDAEYTNFTQEPHERHTLFIAASRRGNVRAVKMILEALGHKAASIAWQRRPSFDGRTALDVAAWSGDIEVVRLLAELAPPADEDLDRDPWRFSRGKYLGNALLKAASALDQEDPRRFAVIQLLVETYGADVNFIHHSTGLNSILLRATERDNATVVRYLLEHGADPNLCSSRNESQEYRAPLHVAASNRNLAVIAALLDAGADPNARERHADRRPLTNVLINAPLNSPRETVHACRLLIEAGAQVNAADDMLVTPLHQVCKQLPMNVPLLELLLSAGGAESVQKRDYIHDATPVEMAMEKGADNLEIVESLLLPHVVDLELRKKVDDWVIAMVKT